LDSWLDGIKASFFLYKLKLTNLSITDDKTSTDKNFQSRAFLNEVPVSKNDGMNTSPAFFAIKAMFETISVSDSLAARPIIIKNFIRRQQILPKEDLVLAT